MGTYTAVCWREEGVWFVHLPELGQTAPADGFSRLEVVARRLVDRVAGSGSAARVVLDLRVPETLDDLLAVVASARDASDRVSVEAVTLRRGLARRLAAHGHSVRDIAVALGVSHARAQQLVTEPRHSSARSPVGLPERPPTRVAAPPGERVGAPAARHGAAAAARPGSAPTAERRSRHHNSYRHEAFLYDGQEEFLARTVPFIVDGLSRGQPVMVAVIEERQAPLRLALGPDATSVHFVDMAELGRNPARIIPAWKLFVDRYGGQGQPVRGIGEPIWSGRRAAEVTECQLHEALLNLAVEPDTPLWLRCPYDARSLDADVLTEALRSHPTVVQGEDHRGSTLYGGVYHANQIFAGDLPRPAVAGEPLSFAAGGLARVRRLVVRAARRAGISDERTADLVLAISELAANSLEHGGGQGTLAMWRQDDALVCEVRDFGHMDDPLVGRRLPSLTSEGGRGVWLANQLCDLVQIRSTPGGTQVRISTWLEPALSAAAR